MYGRQAATEAPYTEILIPKIVNTKWIWEVQKLEMKV
jgi:hypothetical protein